jgi:hypothetical protein
MFSAGKINSYHRSQAPAGYQRMQSTTCWRTPSETSPDIWRSSLATAASSPESVTNDVEEAMDLDSTGERSSPPPYFLWSRLDLNDRSQTRTDLDPVPTSHSLTLSLCNVSHGVLDSNSCEEDCRMNGKPHHAVVVRSTSLCSQPRRSLSVEFATKQCSEESTARPATYNAECHRLSPLTDDDSESFGSSKQNTEEVGPEVIHNPKAGNTSMLDEKRQNCKRVLKCRCYVILSFIVCTVAVLACLLVEYAAEDDECITELNVTLLRLTFDERVYGQHIAADLIINALNDFNQDRSRRMLVMLWHGWTGVGKNYVSRIITEKLSSSSVHKIIVPFHLAHGTVDEARNLRDWMVSNLSSDSLCRLQIFIVDEVDKTTSTVLENLHRTLAELSVTLLDSEVRTVIILLSNDGATDINSHLTNVLALGKSRDTVRPKDLQPILTSRWLAKMYSDRLIDIIVPFLPLERQHVIQCIEYELKMRGLKASEELVRNILSNLQFFPPDMQFFVKTGCRRVSYLIDLFS